MRRQFRPSDAHVLVPGYRTSRRWGLHHGLEGGLAICGGGVCLTVRHARSNQIYSQKIIPMDLWEALDEGQRWNMATSFFKKPGAQIPAGKGGAHLQDKDFQKACPVLFDYLSKGVWPDQSKRELSTVILFVEDGKVKVCLSDKDTSMTLWASSDTLAGVWEALEGRLTQDEPDWRQSRKSKK